MSDDDTHPFRKALSPDHPFYDMSAEEFATDYRTRTRYDVDQHHLMAAEYLSKIQAMPPARRRRAAVFTCRCPHVDRARRLHGCILITVYSQRTADDGERLLVVMHTPAAERAVYDNWAVADDGLDPDLYLPIRCKHGSGRFGRGTVTELLLFEGVPRGATRMIDSLDTPFVTWTPRPDRQ